MTHVADSRLVYTFAKAGDYVLRIRDAQEKGGEEYAYRLKIVPALPDYVLRINTDTARLVQGDSAVMSVTVLRKNDFDGEISLAVQDLPPGLTAGEAVIPAKEQEAKLTITAAANAAPGLYLADRRGHGHGGQANPGAQGGPRGDRSCRRSTSSIGCPPRDACWR